MSRGFWILDLTESDAAFDQSARNVLVLCIPLQRLEQRWEGMFSNSSVVIPTEALERKHSCSAIFYRQLILVCRGESICERLNSMDGRLVGSAWLRQLRVLLPQDVEAVKHDDWMTLSKGVA